MDPIDIAQLSYWLKYGSVEQSLNWRRRDIERLEQIVDEKYHKHHGRATEKHRLIREQEDQVICSFLCIFLDPMIFLFSFHSYIVIIIRILRRKAVHRGNGLKLIKDLKNGEETNAKIITSA